MPSDRTAWLGMWRGGAAVGARASAVQRRRRAQRAARSVPPAARAWFRRPNARLNVIYQQSFFPYGGLRPTWAREA
jgi:hypothetical protein